MKVVDPHMHLWDLDLLHYPWLENPRANWLFSPYGEIAHTYKLDDFLRDTGEIQILKIVHVEAGADPVDWIKESEWLQAIADHPNSRGLPNGFVAAADLSDPAIESVLAIQARFSAIRGIRQILNVHSDPFYGFVDRDFMSDSAWKRGFSLLHKYNLLFDLQIYPSQMIQVAELAKEYPETIIVLNHTGMFVARGSVSGWRAWRDGMRALAANLNVMVKISGMGMADRSWTVESIRPYVLETLDCFGVERSMFASNFPVDRLFSSYSRLWLSFDACVADLNPSEKDLLFRKNAERIYRI